MAVIKFACPYCNRPLKGSSSMQGKSLKCPACQSQITVPTSPSQSDAFELHTADETLSHPHGSSSGSLAKRQWGRGRPIEESTGSFPVQRKDSPAPPESGADAEVFSFSRDPTSLTTFLKIMLWIGSGLAAAALFSEFAQLNLLSSRNFTPEEAGANDFRQGAIAVAQVAVFIVTGIAFLMWIYRANVNCRGFGAKDLKFTAGWSVGYYFIPFLNLYKPYHAMKEIWQASQNPRDWPSQSTSPLLGLWWTLWIFSNAAGQIAYRISSRAESLESIRNATIAAIVSDLIDIPTCIVAALMVTAIFSFQKKLVEQGP